MTGLFDRLRLGALLLAPFITAAAMPALAAGPVDGPGCIGVQLTECLAWLRTTMKLDESFLASSLARRHQTDINGRPLGGGLVTVNAQLPGQAPGQTDLFVILLHLLPDDTVRQVDSNLMYGLVAADTETLYDRSALYEIVWRLVGRRCPGMTKPWVYQFFQNAVKPKIAHQRQDLSTGLEGLHRILSHAPPVPFCGGVSLGYSNRLQWRGSQTPQPAAKLDQFSYIELR
jgi:hypothetical protein